MIVIDLNVELNLKTLRTYLLALILRSSQGLKKVLSSHPGQGDFSSVQSIFLFSFPLPLGQEIRQVICQLNH